MRRFFMPIFAVMACTVSAVMEPATPESQGVDSQGILDFIDDCEKLGGVHSFVLLRHGKLVAEGWWKPFERDRTHMLYSHSKSFISTAIGFLLDEGKLDLDERVIDIFPEFAPEKPGKYWRELRVRDLLTMNIGAASDHISHTGGHWMRQFFTKNIQHAPGTKFKYDSDATYVLSAIVEKRSAKKTMEFLEEKLFSKIGIKKAWTTYSPQGIACGGWGMNMTTRELARFGQFYLQEGKWEGRQLLSSDYVRLASTRQTWSGWINVGARAIGTGSDWEQGYGFQFWRCKPDGFYRADGAFGQSTIVMPCKDAVLSITAGLGDMQRLYDIVWQNLLPAMKESPLPENAKVASHLTERCAKLELPKIADAGNSDESLYGKYEFTNPELQKRFGFKSVALARTANGWSLALDGNCALQTLPIGKGEWARGSVKLEAHDFENLGAIIGSQPTAACGGWTEKGRFTARVYLVETPSYLDFTLSFKEGKLDFLYHYWGMGESRVSLKGCRK